MENNTVNETELLVEIADLEREVETDRKHLSKWQEYLIKDQARLGEYYKKLVELKWPSKT